MISLNSLLNVFGLGSSHLLGDINFSVKIDVFAFSQIFTVNSSFESNITYHFKN